MQNLKYSSPVGEIRQTSIYKAIKHKTFCDRGSMARRTSLFFLSISQFALGVDGCRLQPRQTADSERGALNQVRAAMSEWNQSRIQRFSAVRGIQMRWETNRLDPHRGQCDCGKIGSRVWEEIRWGEQSHQRRVVCAQLSWKWMADLCFHMHTPCLKPQVLRLQKLSRVINHKGAFWSNISWCFNGTAEWWKNSSKLEDPPTACCFTDV